MTSGDSIPPDNSDAASTPRPLAYATASLSRRPPLVTGVAIVSICVGCMGLAVYAVLGNLSVREMIAARQGAAAAQTAAVRVTAQAQARAVARAAATRTAATRSAATLPSFPALNHDQIAQTLASIQPRVLPTSRGSGFIPAQITQAQKDSLSRLLSAGGQKLIDPKIPVGSQTAASLQVVRAFVDRAGTLRLIINHGNGRISRIWLDPAGRQVAIPLPPPRPPPPIFIPSPVANLQSFTNQYVNSLAWLIDYAVHGVLDIVILIGGIYLLRCSPRGVRLLWLYAGLQLLICILDASPVLTAILGNIIPLQFPMVQLPILVGRCIYPIMLVGILRGKTFRGTARGSAKAVVDFGSNDPRPPLFVAVGVASICVGCLSLLFSGLIVTWALVWMADANSQMGRYNAGDLTFPVLVTGTLDALPTVLLLVAAGMLLKSKPGGIRLHRAYGVIKLVTTALAAMTVLWIAPHFPPAIVVIVLGGVYAIVLLIVLRNASLGSQLTGNHN